jgi:hypothetical protein
MERVIITRPIVGLAAMQACAVADITDEEILVVCNAKNPSGTSGGWSKVLREITPGSLYDTKDCLPIQCSDHSDRLHFLVLC